MSSLRRPRADGSLRRAIDPVVAPGAPGYAAAIIRSGEVVALRCRGMADVEAGRLITPDTRFNLASVSKQFAAAAILLLEHDGALNLDDDIRRYVPELPDYGHRITLRMLLHHTSGLRDFEGLMVLAGVDFDRAVTHEAVMRLIADQRELNFVPGSAFLYCNTGYRLLPVVIERLAGVPFGSFLRDRVFTPLGMATAYMPESPSDVRADVAVPYERDTDSGDLCRSIGLCSVFAVEQAGEAGMYASLDDLTKWLVAVADPSSLDGVLGGLATTDPLVDGSDPGYGFGMFVGRSLGRRVLKHGGGQPGWLSQVAWFPDDDLAIVCLANHQDAPTPMALTRAIARDILQPIEPHRPAPGLAAASIEGVYVNAELGLVGSVEVQPTRTLFHEFTDGNVIEPIGDSTWAGSYGEGWPHLRFDQRGVDLQASERGGAIRLDRVVPRLRPHGDVSGYIGRYSSDELPATYEIAMDADGLGLIVDGPSGRRPRRPLLQVAPQMFVTGVDLKGWSAPIAHTLRGAAYQDGLVTEILVSHTQARDVRLYRQPDADSQETRSASRGRAA